MLSLLKDILDYVKIPAVIIQDKDLIFKNINYKEIFGEDFNVAGYIVNGKTSFLDQRGVKFYIKLFQNQAFDFKVCFIVDFVKNEIVSTFFSSIEGVLSLHTLVNNPYEGVILVDKEGRIKYYNSLNERFFNAKLSKYVGKHITNLIPNSKLHLVAKTGKEEIGKVQKFKDELRVVSRIPVNYKNNTYGAIGKIIFKEAKDIDQLTKELQNLKNEINKYKTQIVNMHNAHYTFDDLIGEDDEFLAGKVFAKKIAPTDSTVILLGESGTGKELFAHAIHLESIRRNKPFVKVNCASIPSELAESELFGYTEGAFTGALKHGKPGKFELANGGTIFLDEIGDLPLSLQAKLLRVLQEKEVERIGKSSPQKVDFRLICATNRNLKKMVEKNQFREDLYYRIYTVPIKIPPLRERRGDIEKLAYHLLNILSNYTEVREIEPQYINILKSYKWPGNIRELKNVIELSIYKADSNKLTIKTLPSYIFENIEINPETVENYSTSSVSRLKEEMEKRERESIIKALKVTNGNKTKTAELLGIHRTGLHKKLNKYKIKD